MLLELFISDNDLKNNFENNAWKLEHNAWKLEHNAAELQEILNRIIQGNCEHNYFSPNIHFNGLNCKY